MLKGLMRFARDESGATAIEYGLIAGLVSVIVLVALKTMGVRLNTKFGTVGTALN